MRSALNDPQRLKRIARREVQLDGIVRGYAAGSVLLELAADGEDNDNCIDLVMEPAHFAEVAGRHHARIKGRLITLDLPAGGAVVSLKHQGIKFYPSCRAGSAPYPFIVVDEIESIQDTGAVRAPAETDGSYATSS